ncbi:ATP synthase subunit e, mitochondrial [Aix galericulata]|nr:ATP synthase subunit e, mitochondrial [Aix galericulata]
MIPPVQVSPLIKFTRYSALLMGMIYGKKRYDYLKPIAEEERRVEAEEKKKREELERIAKELAEAQLLPAQGALTLEHEKPSRSAHHTISIQHTGRESFHFCIVLISTGLPLIPIVQQPIEHRLNFLMETHGTSWESLGTASSYLLRDLELLHHAKLVVHLNAALHQLQLGAIEIGEPELIDFELGCCIDSFTQTFQAHSSVGITRLQLI